MNLIQSCIIAFSMYSRIPMPKVEWTEKGMKYALCFFPMVGIVIGVCLEGAYKLTRFLQLSDGFFGAAAVAIPIVITGGIHMDGFFDTIDALYSYESRERKLEILQDPHTGAFALIWGGVYYLISYGIWSNLSSPAIHLLCGSFILSRGFSGLAVVTFPMAKNTGLCAAFSGNAHKKITAVVMVIFIVFSGILMIKVDFICGAAGISAAAGIFFYYYRVSKKQFGGITGDLAGYFLQLCELTTALAVIVTFQLLERGWMS